MDTPLIDALDIHMTYGERVVTHALRGVDLTLHRGAFCALSGASGCGKTTLLNLIGLLDRPTSGRLILDGEDVAPLSDEARTTLRATKLGFVFQFHHLLPAFTAMENVMLPLISRHGRATAEFREKAAHLLNEVGLADRADYKSTDLSGGQKQRVAIARALVADPMLVLADEPTGNLDTESADQVMELLATFNQRAGTAFLIVTHDDSVAERCHRIVHMVDGRVDSERTTASHPLSDQ